MARILVTGSRGVVGRYLTQILRARGHEVHGLDLAHCAEKNYTRCDVSEYRQIEVVISKGFDFVYHAAAEFGRWNGEAFYEQLWATNAVGTKNIIRLQEKLRFKLIHFSSSEVYGDYRDVMREDVMLRNPILQMNDYAMSKWVNEMQIRNSKTQFGTETTVVRLFNTYGPGEVYHPYRSVNARLCYSALNGLPVTIHCGHLRTSTYIEDACTTAANIVDNFTGDTYNIGGQRRHDIETLVRIIWDYSKADKSLITYAEPEILTTKIKRVDVKKAVDDLNHKDTVSLEEGIAKTIDWMREQL